MEFTISREDDAITRLPSQSTCMYKGIRISGWIDPRPGGGVMDSWEQLEFAGCFKAL